MKLLLLACAGGAIGAGLRHLVNRAAVNLFDLEVAWATLAVNVLGSLLMGIVVAAVIYRLPDAMALRIFLATGVLGGFTTFSAFSIDVFALAERGDVMLAVAYVVASVVLSILACSVGFLLTRFAVA